MKIGKLQDRDACLALVFLVLLFWFFWRAEWLVYCAMAVLLAGMIWPRCMHPFALAWFGLAHFLGKITSTILLTAVWIVLVLPVGLFRRMLGKDRMGFKNWRGSGSAFIVRDHAYVAKDLENPY